MSILIQITIAPIVTPVSEDAALAGCGAIVEFRGIVRPLEDGKPILGIDYECFLEMAEHQLQILAKKHLEFRSLAELICIHRVGFVPRGEASLYIRMASAHRAESFQAITEFITDLKRLVPIWKHVVQANP